MCSKKNTINERLKTTVIGVGQCGNSIAAKIEEFVNELDGNKDNVSFVGINTSTEDLAAVSLSHKIHIEGSKGAACNRESSVQDLAMVFEPILDELKSYIIPDSIVFIATSLGGGTGSAISPILADILLGEGYQVGMICVLPADNESLKIKNNAIQAFNEIEELKPRMSSIFILDNNANEKLKINATFASLFASVLCINNKSVDGNMDLAEIEACLKTPSFSIITRAGKTNGTTANIIDVLNRDNNIFAKRDDKIVTVMGLSEAVSAKDSKIDMTELRKSVGTAPTEFHGYMSASEENVLILSGLTMPYGRVDALAESVEQNADIIKNSQNATMQVRTARTLDVFSKPVEVVPTTTQTKTPSGLERLKKLKANAIK
jgi:hypothetical protein